MIELSNILDKLSKERNIFHSEKDFQHALAWNIQQNSNLNIRLERPLNEKEHLDIFAFDDTENIAIELKYKTKAIGKKNELIEIQDEVFNLKNQSAKDQARFDFIKDISRLEKNIKKYKNHQNYVGYAIFLTNDESYWKKPDKEIDAQDKDFRIHDGEKIEGKLSWNKSPSPGTLSKRDKTLELEGKYNLNWNDYYDFDLDFGFKNGKFRYLLVKVN